VLQYLPQVPYVFSNCGIWDVEKADAQVTQNVHTTVPVLLVSGSLDAITPPSSAELVARNMPNSHQITFPGAGHGVAVQSPECFTTVMNGFLGTPQAFDQSCVSAITVAPFGTSPGNP
jgi:pimeloyl-ACP methyl ester carboxylesterase